MIHIFHAAIALFIAALAGMSVLLLQRQAGRPMRATLHGRIHTLTLPRRRTWSLPAWARDLLRLVVGDVRGPVSAGLYTSEIERSGLPGLRWRLLHAGCGHRSIAWLRLQQGEAAASLLALAAAILIAVSLPLVSLLLVTPAALLAGYALPLALLARRATSRRERLRVELVGLLYGLAAFVAAGRPLDRALDRMAQRPGELSYELFKARELAFQGLDMGEALGVLAARCDVVELYDAVSLIVAARGDDVDKGRVPAMLAALAEATRAGLRERRRVRVAQALLRTTVLGTLLGLPLIGTALLYPVVIHTLRTLG